MQDYSTVDHSNAPESSVYAPQEKRFPWGCLVGGCLGVFLLMLIGVGAAGWAGWSFYRAQLEKYTSDAPQELPVVEASDEEIAAIEKRMEEFQTEVDSGDASNQLILTADDINTLISKEEKLRGKVYVKVADGEVSAEVSVPLDELPGGKGRYFNGSVSAEVELRDGVLIVTLADAEVNGNPVPEAIMEGMRKENLAKEMYKDPEFAKKLGRFESIIIDDDRIVLTLKEKQPEADPPQPAESDETLDDAPSSGGESTSDDPPPSSEAEVQSSDELDDNALDSSNSSNRTR